jgi:hypothetical protein
LIEADTAVSSGIRSSRAELIPAVTALAAALTSLAFFRTWIVFSTSPDAEGLVRLSGAALAREMDGAVPWLYITPITMIGVLGLSCLRLLAHRPGVRGLYGLGLPLLAIPVLVWPAKATARVTHNLVRIQITGATSISLTHWWWVYCASLGIVTLLAVIDLALAVRQARHARLR